MLNFQSLGLSGWNGGDNPFALGYLQLVQDGTDTLLQADRDAAGAAMAGRRCCGCRA